MARSGSITCTRRVTQYATYARRASTERLAPCLLLGVEVEPVMPVAAAVVAQRLPRARQALIAVAADAARARLQQRYDLADRLAHVQHAGVLLEVQPRAADLLEAQAAGYHARLEVGDLLRIDPDLGRRVVVAVGEARQPLEDEAAHRAASLQSRHNFQPIGQVMRRWSSTSWLFVRGFQPRPMSSKPKVSSWPQMNRSVTICILLPARSQIG